MLPADCGLYKISLSILDDVFSSFFVVQSFLPSSDSSLTYCIYIYVFDILYLKVFE